jgi:hypothetical protein
MSLNLQSYIYTQQDLKAAITEVKKYSSWFNQAAIKMRVTKNNEYELPVIAPTATIIINEWLEGNPPSQKSLEALIEELEEYESIAPTVTITLAAPPPNSLKLSITGWFRQNVDAKMLVNFKFNATILGGMVVSYGSHVYDWSFRRQILASREKFPEVLRRV